MLTRAELSGLLSSEPTVAVRMPPAIGARLRSGTQAPTEGTPVV